MKFSETLIKAMTVALEVTGTDISKEAARVILRDLSNYPELQVLGAFKRCMREVKGRLTLADIIQRIEDGRPGPEEAWAMIPKDEGASVFWTSEMRDAFAVAYRLIEAGETVQARMAFLERYRNLVQIARDGRLPVVWQFSPGLNKDGRELCLLDAAEKGRVSVEHVRALLPYHREDVALSARLLAIEGVDPKALPAPTSPPPEAAARLEDLRRKFGKAA